MHKKTCVVINLRLATGLLVFTGTPPAISNDVWNLLIVLVFIVSQNVNINGLSTSGYELGSRTKIVVNFSRPYAACEPERGVLDAHVRGESCGVSIGGPMGMCPMSRSIIRLAEMWNPKGCSLDGQLGSDPKGCSPVGRLGSDPKSEEVLLDLELF